MTNVSLENKDTDYVEAEIDISKIKTNALSNEKMDDEPLEDEPATSSAPIRNEDGTIVTMRDNNFTRNDSLESFSDKEDLFQG